MTVNQSIYDSKPEYIRHNMKSDKFFFENRVHTTIKQSTYDIKRSTCATSQSTHDRLSSQNRVHTPQHEI